MTNLKEIRERMAVGCECDTTRVLCTYCNEIGEDIKWLVSEVETADAFTRAVAKRLGHPVSDLETLQAVDYAGKGRIHLGLVHSTDADYWEMRVMPERGAGCIIRVQLTPEQFSGLMAGEMVTDVGLE